MIFFVLLYSLIYITISWRNIWHGVAIFFFLLPAYLIRFSIGPIPSTLLEVMVISLIGVVAVKHCSALWRHSLELIKNNRLLSAGIGLFLLGATISIFTAVDMRAALGEWKAFYIEPVVLFFVLSFLLRDPCLRRDDSRRGGDKKADVRRSTFDVATQRVALPLILSGLLTATLAIFQHFTGWFVPEAFWANDNSYRVTGWYGFPNGVGMFLAPLVPITFYTGILLRKKILFLVPCSLFVIAILFAKSTGALVGLAAGIGFLLLIYKKTRTPTIVIGALSAIALFSLPQLAPIKTELLAQDRSGQIRIAMWGEAVQLIKDRPFFGAGLASYSERIEPYHQTVNGEGIEIFHHPHNLFLTLYLNLGLIGLVGSTLIVISLFRKLSQQNVYLLSSIIVILIMGLVDSPYIKNDLAMLFWLIIALFFCQYTVNLTAES